MIRRGHGPVGDPRGEAALAQHLEGGSRTVLKKMPVDIKKALPVFARHDSVPFPDLLE
jgi:hypothetical protein